MNNASFICLKIYTKIQKKVDDHSLIFGRATAATNLGVSDRLFKKHRRWASEKVKDNYVHKDLKSKLSVSKNLG